MSLQTQVKTAQFASSSEGVSFEIRPIAGRIGAEIVGLDLSQTLSDRTIQDIRQTLGFVRN